MNVQSGDFFFSFSIQRDPKCVRILAKAAALRMTINIDGAPIVSQTHTHAPIVSQTYFSFLFFLSFITPRQWGGCYGCLFIAHENGKC
jgi:hypothetical protein